jgi:hypothetical protein
MRQGDLQKGNPMNKPDVLVRNEGTAFVFCPLSERAHTWIDENV